MLIKGAEIYSRGVDDVRIEQGIITTIGQLAPLPGETVVDASGGALLPGLHDHHIHFLSYAAALASLDCSPAAAPTHEALARLLQQQPACDSWLRGTGYHESIAGDIDRHWLDQYCPDRPVRIQHRTGRLWIFNSRGLALLTAAAGFSTTPPSLPDESLESGRFFDADQTLASLIGRQLPPVNRASKRLASYGITGFSDMTPSNDADALALFQQLRSQHLILQDVRIARRFANHRTDSPTDTPGPIKIHLHENNLPAMQDLVEHIQQSHMAGAPVAIHCVTEIELLFSLAALEEAGTLAGDRIEHASVTPEHALDRMRALDITVVTQPGFITEKGDTYLHDMPVTDHHALYRCNSFLQANIALAGSSDAPFGSADPWAAMRAAVTRRTASGHVLGQHEALTPEQALTLFLGTLESPRHVRHIQPGAPADICLLKYPWHIVRTRLSSDDVRLVLSHGIPIYEWQAGLQA